MAEKPFTLEPSRDRPPVRPKEPLYSLLCESPTAAVEHLYAELIDFEDDAQLNQIIPSTGLTRAAFIAQVLLVLEAKRR